MTVERIQKESDEEAEDDGDDEENLNKKKPEIYYAHS